MPRRQNWVWAICPLDALRLMFSFCEFEELVRLRATCGTIKKESETILFARSVNKLPTAHRMDFYINKPSFSLRPGWTQTYQNFYATIAFAIDDLAYLSSQEKVRANIGLGGDGTAVSLNWREEMPETYQDPYDDAHKQWKREVTFRAPLDVLDTFDVWDLFYSKLEDRQHNLSELVDQSVPLDILLDKVQPLKRLFLGLIIMSGSKNLEGSWKYGIALTSWWYLLFRHDLGSRVCYQDPEKLGPPQRYYDAHGPTSGCRIYPLGCGFDIKSLSSRR